MAFLNRYYQPRDAPEGASLQQQFNVGISFRPVGQDEAINSDDNILTKHWSLVFTPIKEPQWSLQVELEAKVDGQDAIAFPCRVFDNIVNAFPLAIWKGNLYDVIALIQAHPMRYSKYSAAWNNCQHWVATLLVMLEGLHRTRPDSTFSVTQRALYKKVLKVLNKSGKRLYHDSNFLLEAAHLMGVGGGTAVFGAAVVAAEVTTTAMVPTLTYVPATGLAAWFGGIGTIATIPVATTVPTGLAIAGMIAAPITILATAGVGIAYLVKWDEWKDKTIFDDPRLSGARINGSSLSGAEMGLRTGSSSSSGGWGNVLLGSAVGSSVGGTIGLASAASLSPGIATVAAPIAAGGTLLGARYASRRS